MVLRSDELHRNLQHLNGMLTTHEAAKQLDLSYWYFMHLVEAGRIPGVRVVDRWLFSPDDLADYRRSKYGKLEDLARAALNDPSIGLTEKQETICQYLIKNERPSEIARQRNSVDEATHEEGHSHRPGVVRIRDVVSAGFDQLVEVEGAVYPGGYEEGAGRGFKL